MIVVDTNVIGYLEIASERTELAARVFKKDPDWIAPPLWRSEFLNVLAGYVRRKTILIADAQLIIEDALSIMSGNEVSALPIHILELTTLSTCTSYDCEFVALAQELTLPLVTVDKQILAQFPRIAISLEEFARN